MLGQYKPSEVEFIDIRVALHMRVKMDCFLQRHHVDLNMSGNDHAWIGPDFPDTIPNTNTCPGRGIVGKYD